MISRKKTLKQILHDEATARARGNEKELLNCLFTKINELQLQRRFNETIITANEFIALSGKTDTRLWEVQRFKAEAHTDLMVCNNHRENFNEALSSAKEYKRLVSLEDDQIEIQRALITIGNIYSEYSRLSKYSSCRMMKLAERNYQEAMENIPWTLNEHEKGEMTLNCYLNLINIASLRGWCSNTA